MDAVLNWLWQGGVVAAAASVMLLALERARANVRYIVCWAALLAIVALPAVRSIPWTAASTNFLYAPQAGPVVPLPDAWWMWTPALLAAWIVWASFHMFRFIAAVAAIRRARTRSHVFPPKEESNLTHWIRHRCARRPATLVVSDAVTSAAVLGWGPPVIAISPSLLETLNADELDRILIHEWAHVQRRDDFLNILQIAIRTIVGWHPAVWWIDRRLHIEREIACDEIAVAITGSPATYAECLVKLASLRRPPRTLLTAPAVLTASSLRARVEKLVSAQRSIAPFWSRSIAVAIVTMLWVLSGALGGLALVEAEALALPIVSPRMHTAAIHHITPTAAPISDIKPDRSLRTVSRVVWTQRPRPESPPQQPPLGTPLAVSSEDNRAIDSAAPRTTNAEVTEPPVLASVPLTIPDRSARAAEQARAPWTVAADGGVAIGRKSRDAGVATAGFFSRFARRVAGSF